MARHLWGSFGYLSALLLFALLVTAYPSSPGTLVDAAASPGGTPVPGPRKPNEASPSGGSWMRVSPMPTDRNLSSVFFADGQTGWAAGSGTVLRTKDGGATWAGWYGGLTGLSAMDFVDAGNGWVVGGNSAIIRTSDGGASWLQQTLGITTTLTSVDFTDAETGWAAGYGGVILYTANSGATWTRQVSSTAVDLTSVHFLDARTGWAVGDRGDVLRYVPSYPARAYMPVVVKNQSGGW